MPLPVPITVESNGGTKVPPLRVVPGAFIQPPAAPSKTGYRFVGRFTGNSGWFAVGDSAKPYSFKRMPEWDITLYAGIERLTPPLPLLLSFRHINE